MKKVSIVTTAFLVLASILVTFQITFLSLDKKYDQKLSDLEIEMSEFNKLFEIKQLVDGEYINDYDTEDLVDALASAYSEGIGDKYGKYYSLDNLSYVSEHYYGEVCGIGVSVICNENGEIEVLFSTPGSPAEKVGIKEGDIITAIDGVTVEELGGYDEAVAKVKGETGTSVMIQFRRDNNVYQCSVVREKIDEITVRSHIMSDGKTGFVRVTGYSAKTAEQFKAAMGELATAGAERYVFDMRYNGGGELSAITAVLDYLLPEGPIVRVVDRNGKESVTSSDALCVDAPMAVLVNGYTASAAELFTIGLRDYKKAVIVGTKTYGKGTVQTLHTLTDGSILSLSNKMYCGPYSDNYEGIGITPDVVVEMSDEASQYHFHKLPDEVDNQLQEALKALDDFNSFFEAK